AFWKPVTKVWSPTVGLSVGVHLRDFNVQVVVAEKIKSIYPQFVLELVVPARMVPIIPRSNAIRIVSNISDEELREKYSTSAFHLMALHNCTANNALLEGMSCGLPSILTNIGGVQDYIDAESAILCSSNNVNSMVEAARLLVENEALNYSMRVAARKRALD